VWGEGFLRRVSDFWAGVDAGPATGTGEGPGEGEPVSQGWTQDQGPWGTWLLFFPEPGSQCYMMIAPLGVGPCF